MLVDLNVLCCCGVEELCGRFRSGHAGQLITISKATGEVHGFVQAKNLHCFLQSTHMGSQQAAAATIAGNRNDKQVEFQSCLDGFPRVVCGSCDVQLPCASVWVCDEASNGLDFTLKSQKRPHR